MNCRKVQNLISAYVDCELPGMEMLAIRRHLSDCGECRLEYETLLSIKRAFGSLQEKHPAEILASCICEELDHVTPPTWEQLAASLQKHLAVFPVRMRLAAAGMSLFAVLLMLQAGKMSTNNYTNIPMSPAVPAAALIEQPSFRLFPIATPVEAASLSTAPSSPERWMFPDETDKPSQFLGSVNLVLASY